MLMCLCLTVVSCTVFMIVCLCCAHFISCDTLSSTDNILLCKYVVGVFNISI